jgi:hypothetical protein
MPGGKRSIEDVVGIGRTVAGTIDAEQRPGAGNELHRPDGAIPD